jgi:thiol-disulfide isomerase/thioredoxin
VSGRRVSDLDVAGAKATLVMFICNHCPFVKHVLPEIEKLAAEFSAKGIGVVAISSNDVVGYPQDGPGPMKQLATERRWAFPYLYDDDQSVAAAFHAACTPDFFAFDANRKLAYRGRLDDSRPGSPAPLTGRELRAALDAILAGRAPAADQKPSIGCNIKWKVPQA